MIVHNREESEISRDLFRADMIPTEGDLLDETPNNSVLNSRKNLDAPPLNTINETEESNHEISTTPILMEYPHSTNAKPREMVKEIYYDEMESEIPNELNFQMLFNK